MGSTLQFTREVGQSVTVPNSQSLNPAAGMSITAWVYGLDWDGNYRVLQKGNNDSQYRLLVEGSQLVWEIENVGRLAFPTLPPTNRWVHLAGTYDGGRMTLYVDGVEASSIAASGAIPATSDPLYLGTKSAVSGVINHLNGYLDEVRLYSRPVSADEVASLASQLGTISITATDPSAQKGTGNTGLFTISRTGPIDQPAPVNLTMLGGVDRAVPGSDFTLNPSIAGFQIPSGKDSATLQVTPLDTIGVTGARTVDLTLDSAPGYLVTGEPNAQILVQDSPLNLWKIYAFGGLAAAQGPSAGDAADVDQDGLVTLMEAALGGGPSTEDSALLPFPQVELIDGQLYLTSTYTRPTPVMQGITYSHWNTLHLTISDWQPADLVEGYPFNNGDGTETIKIRTAAPISGQPHQFLQLQIHRPQE